MRKFQQKLNTSYLILTNYKTKKKAIHKLTPFVGRRLRNILDKSETIFEKYKYDYLFGKRSPITEKNFIKLVNKDLKNTCLKYNVPFMVTSKNFKFRLPNLLKNFSPSLKSLTIGSNTRVIESEIKSIIKIDIKDIDQLTFSVDFFENCYWYW